MIMASASVAVASNRLKISSTDCVYSMAERQAPKSCLILRVQAFSISETFSSLRRQKRVAFIPYITAGDPDLSTTAKALKMLSCCGADIIELGLPCNAPVLDGPVIQASHKRALASKTNLKAVISMLKEVVPQISCPVVMFSYYNLISSSRSQWFLSALEDAGAQGLIVPDLPFEDGATLRREAAEKNIDMVLLTTPATPKKKMKAIVDASEGFVYLVSSVGVTGARDIVNSKTSRKPVAVGTPINSALQISSWGADGVIVGSAIVKLLGEANSGEEGLRHVKYFVACLTAALPLGKNEN
ncbi:hypothetical protein ZIOFF_055140 [Zingiber officinale]|uniref:tryptophan synthase n=1 Tax=Zingiber officinale TaxID=94328 RepID=A0A8J5FIP8_ZINOF|nr:hypothetical protein ZIOFF_055140 [Zingiber officinale]